MRRQIVYIAGQYRSKYGVIGRLINIIKARRVAIQLAKRGYCCFVPHLNWGLMDGHRDDKFWLDCGLKMLPKCQIIYMMTGWDKSAGAREEFLAAEKHKLNVMFEGDETIYKNFKFWQLLPEQLVTSDEPLDNIKVTWRDNIAGTEDILTEEMLAKARETIEKDGDLPLYTPDVPETVIDIKDDVKEAVSEL
jgi:hypothetical protein